MNANVTAGQITLVAFLLFITTCVNVEPAAALQERAAQEKAENVVTRLYHVKNVDPGLLAEALVPFTRGGHAMVVPSRPFKTLTLSGKPEVLDAMESMIRDLDVAPPAPKNIEVTAYLLAAANAAQGEQKPPDILNPVLKQLRATFQYQSYQLLDTVLLRSRVPEGAGTSGFLSFPGMSGRGTPYTFEYQSPDVNHDPKGATIHLNKLRIFIDVRETSAGSEGKTSTSIYPSGLNTNIDLREGQMVVVGKTGIGAGDKAIIAVLTAKVLD